MFVRLGRIEEGIIVIKDFRKNVRLPEDVMWLMPGLQVKRWFALIFLGAVLMTLGVLILFDIKPVFYTMEFIRTWLKKYFPETKFILVPEIKKNL